MKSNGSSADSSSWVLGSRPKACQETNGWIMKICEGRPRDYGFWGDLSLVHELACDNDPRVQGWIRATQWPKIMSRDLQEVLDVAVWDTIKCEFMPVPASPFTICSWVCHDVSRRNPKRKFQCIEQEEGLTGSSFALFVQYLRIHKPRIFMSEMVAGLMDPGSSNDKKNDLNSNHAVVLRKLDEAGYSVCWLLVCPSGLPVTRQRIYYVGMNKAAHPNADRLVKSLHETWQCIYEGSYSRVELEAFLLPPGHVQVAMAKVKAEEKVQEHPKQPKPGKDEWTRIHKKMCDANNATCWNYCYIEKIREHSILGSVMLQALALEVMLSCGASCYGSEQFQQQN